LDSIYPHCAKILAKKWTKTVDEYLIVFPPNHYHLNSIAKRFPEFLAKNNESYIARHPFIVDLADYEWTELEVLEKPVRIIQQTWLPLNSPGDFTNLKPILNPTLVLRQYNYPIVRIVTQLESHSKLPKSIKAKSTNVSIYRDPISAKCKFIELGNTASKIIDSCSGNNATFTDLIKLAIKDNPHSDPQKTVTELLELVEQFQKLSVFVGNKRI
jgi:hypothetical protein